jgi:hypothetical protein
MLFAAASIGVAAAVLFQFFNKKLLKETPKAAEVSGIMFLGGFIVVVLVALFSKNFGFNLAICLVAAVNGVGAWFFLRAIKVSLSQSLLVMPITNVVAVSLTAAFLGEWQLLDPRTALGILTLIGSSATIFAVILFSGGGRQKNAGNRKWLYATLGYVLVFGVVSFLAKYFANEQIAISHFLFSWYVGTLIGSFLPRVIEKNWVFIPRSGQFWKYFFLALTMVGSNAAAYWALLSYPGAVVFPVFTFFYAAGSALLGLFVFKERKSFKTRDWVGMAVGAVGAIILIVVSGL